MKELHLKTTALLLLAYLATLAVSAKTHHHHHHPKKLHYKHQPHSNTITHHKHQSATNTVQPRPAKVEVYTKKGLTTVQIPTYEFGYKIHDPHSKNYQEKSEVRLGDAVQGFYSVLQPNGQIRVVRYHSDDTGFHSKVSLHQSKKRSKS